MEYIESMHRSSYVVLNNCVSRAKGLGTKASEEIFKEYLAIREELGNKLTEDDMIYLFEIADFYMKQLEKERNKASEVVAKKLKYDSKDTLPALKKIYGKKAMEVTCYALYLDDVSVDAIAEKLDMPEKKIISIITAVERELTKYKQSEIYRALIELNADERVVNARVSNALRQHGIYDIATLKEYELETLQGFRNIGAKGKEILKVLYDTY